jgi:hypothetical protein
MVSLHAAHSLTVISLVSKVEGLQLPFISHLLRLVQINYSTRQMFFLFLRSHTVRTEAIGYAEV